MFRTLDKDGDGYVMLEDLLKYFVPAKQVREICVLVSCKNPFSGAVRVDITFFLILFCIERDPAHNDSRRRVSQL